MRYKGSHIVPVRIPEPLLAAMRDDLRRMVYRGRNAPPESFGEYIRLCIGEHLAKRARSRTWRKARTALHQY